MDDQPGEKNSAPEDESEVTRVPVSINSTPTTPSEVVAENNTISPETPSAEPLPPTPEPSSTPGVPIAGISPVESPQNQAPQSAEPPVAPPAPGAVISSGDSSTGPTAPLAPAQVVVSSSGGGRRWLKLFIALLIIVLVAAAAWFAYDKFIKSKPATPAVTTDKTIPLMRVGMRQADFGGIYPSISDNDYSVSVNSQMFDGLVRYEDRSKIVPDLASTWTNPDNNTWLFTIKKNVKFHDGHTLAPSDVKQSLDSMVANTSDFAKTFAGTIASVQLVGTDQVKITTKTPDPTLLNKLTLLYIIDANAPKGSEPSMAGTGAYEVKPGTTPTDSNVQMVAFDNYLFGRPTTRALTFTNVDDPNEVKDFNAGKYDMVGAIPPDMINQAKNPVIFNVSEADSNYVAFNTIKPSPVQNKQVREAIRYALNAGAIGKANGENLTPVSQVVPPSIPGYDPAISPYKQNIQKAKQLLTQAGYPNGLTLTLSVPTVNSQEATEISNELKQVGITVNLDKHTDFDEFINYFTQGNAEMYVVDYASDTLDAADIYQTTLPAANYNNPKVNDLLNQANATLNPATRLKLLQQVTVLVDQDIPVVPLGTTSDTWIMNKHYDIQQDSTSGYLPVYFYTVKLK